MTRPELVEELLALPAADRAKVAAALLTSLDGPGGEVAADDEDWARSWGEELTRRSSDGTAGIPADDVFAEVEERLSVDR